MDRIYPYLMESEGEILRLELKTDPDALREQAHWCGIRPGQRILDAGCGPGKTTFILYNMIQPGGEIIGIDQSEDMVRYATDKYGNHDGILFYSRDFKHRINDLGEFDIIWLRFILEYHLRDGIEIIKNLSSVLKAGGYLCLLDLDHNCLNQYPLPVKIQDLLTRLIDVLQREHNFDPYAGRKLYSYLYGILSNTRR